MALHFDYALRLRSNSVKTPGLYGYAGVVVHRSASLASMYSFVVASLSLWHIAMPLGRRGVHTITLGLMQLYSYILDLRIWHPKLDPDPISQNLGIKPHIAHRVGDARRTPQGTLREGFYKESYWSSNPFNHGWRDSSEVQCENSLEELLAFLEPHKEFLTSISKDGTVRIWISSHSKENFAIELPPGMLKQLAAFGATFVHDVYQVPQNSS